MISLFHAVIFGLVGGIVRVFVGYSKAYGMLSYPAPFRLKRALLTITVSLFTGAISPSLVGSENIGIAFIAGFAGTDLLEALAKGLMKAKTGFATGFAKSRYSEFGYQYGEEFGLTRRQQKALTYIEKNGKITNDEYEKINRVSHATAARDLKKLSNLGIIKKVGKGKKLQYVQK